MYGVIARFRVKDGHVDDVIAALREAAPPSRDEPGCHFYDANQDLTDPNLIVMYEQYENEAAFEAHRETPHFKTYVEARVLPFLESRARETFDVVTRP